MTFVFVVVVQANMCKQIVALTATLKTMATQFPGGKMKQIFKVNTEARSQKFHTWPNKLFLPMLQVCEADICFW